VDVTGNYRSTGRRIVVAVELDIRSEGRIRPVAFVGQAESQRSVACLGECLADSFQACLAEFDLGSGQAVVDPVAVGSSAVEENLVAARRDTGRLDKLGSLGKCRREFGWHNQ
jgi:hypothetical protein